MSTFDEKIEQLINDSEYTGILINCMDINTTNVPISRVKPIELSLNEFFEEPPIIDRKIVIRSANEPGFSPDQIQLFRLTYNIVANYEEPRLEDTRRIINELTRQFEKVLFTGIHPNYGLQRNEKVRQVPLTANNINEFAGVISTELEEMLDRLSALDFVIYFPTGWYKKLSRVQGMAENPDEYVMKFISRRAKRKNGTVEFYDSNLIDKIYIVNKNSIHGYFGNKKMSINVYDDKQKEELIYKSSYNIPVLVLDKEGCVKAISGLVAPMPGMILTPAIELKNDPKYFASEAVIEKPKAKK